MKKDLPGVFANKIDRKIENNSNYSVTKSEEKIEKKANDERKVKLGMNINQKIQNIFNSPQYVYKADVIITTREGKIERRIIGKNGDNLITIDNELINIGNIEDIEFKN